MQFLQGKTALVTGSTSGIGLGMAHALASHGANLVLNGFGDAQAACDAVAKHGTQVMHNPADMTQPTEIEAMMAEATARLGRVDIVINNAGIQHVAPLASFPTERWDAVIAINLSSAFHTTRLALPAMIQAGWGRIINIASTHGLVASAHKAAYVAAKHGIIGLTKVTAMEAANSGVTCNAICPGWVLTPLVQQQVAAKAQALGITEDEAKRQLVGEKQPQTQFTTPEQLAEMAVFMCRDAASNVQGAAWTMDGGWTAQ